VFSRNAAFSKFEAAGNTNWNDVVPLFAMLVRDDANYLMPVAPCVAGGGSSRSRGRQQQEQGAAAAGAGAGRHSCVCGSQLENTNYDNFIVD
jgi:hypothetical protein